MGQPGMPGLGIHHSCRPRQGQVSECGSRGGGCLGANTRRYESVVALNMGAGL